MILDYEKLVAESHRMAANNWNNRTLSDLGDLLPENQDKNVLFRHNWLAIGQAFGLVASSGVGKSSMADQMALHWVLGHPFLAEPTRPLKISMIQAEDSDRDLQEQRDGMMHGMALEGFDSEAIAEALRGVAFPTDFIGVQGDNFLQKLAEYQSDCRFDLIFINPLQRFFGGDISSQEDTSKFCAGLDRILKHPDYGCTMGIVMHTPKFHSGVKDGRQSVDDYAEYAMAGSQEWTAWIRAVINFQKHGTSEDYFDIKASKRGKRLGWKDADENPTTKRVFKHSEGFIYWQEVTDPEEIASIPEAQQKTSAKPSIGNVSQFASTWATTYRDSIIDKTDDDVSEEIYLANKKKFSRFEVLKVVDYLIEHHADFNLEIIKFKSKNGKKEYRLFKDVSHE